MGFEIREARPGEERGVLRMYEWLFAPPGSVPPAWDPPAAERRLAAAIEGERSTVLLAETGDDFSGLCTAYLELDSVRYGQRCWVEDLAVGPEHRSEGIGAALLRAACDWALRHGATHLELDSGSARTDAHRFYERLDPSWTGMQYAWWLEAAS